VYPKSSLVYAGNADFMCNYMGNEAWMEVLESVFQSEFLQASGEPLKTDSGKVVGRVRSAGAGHTAGNFTFVEVFEAG
jgi:carboxypeptidase C (cathepsin A)